MNSFTDNFTINGITLTAQPICRQGEVLTPDALAFVAKLHRATAERRQELLQARRTPPGRDRQGPGPAVPPRDRVHPQRPDLARRSPGPGPGGPPRGDHRPGGQEDDHQRAELRRQGVARGHGRLLHAVLAQRHPGPAEPHRRAGTPDRLHLPGGQGIQAPPGRGTAHHRGPPPRLAPARKAHAHRRRTRSPAASWTSACTSSTTPAACWPRARARTSTCRRSRTTSKPGCGTTSSSWPRTCSASRRAPSAPPC